MLLGSVSPLNECKYIEGVENGEYYGVSSSDYNSDLSEPSPRALVTCQYKRKHYSEVKLDQ